MDRSGASILPSYAVLLFAVVGALVGLVSSVPLGGVAALADDLM